MTRLPEPAPDADESEPPPGSASRGALDRRRRRDMAFALPMAGVTLLVSPLLDAVSGAGILFGIPVVAIYFFGTWFALIALTAWTARRLRRDAEGSD